MALHTIGYDVALRPEGHGVDFDEPTYNARMPHRHADILVAGDRFETGSALSAGGFRRGPSSEDGDVRNEALAVLGSLDSAPLAPHVETSASFRPL